MDEDMEQMIAMEVDSLTKELEQLEDSLKVILFFPATTLPPSTICLLSYYILCIFLIFSFPPFYTSFTRIFNLSFTISQVLLLPADPLDARNILLEGRINVFV